MIGDVAGMKVGNVTANLCAVFKILLAEDMATHITARSNFLYDAICYVPPKVKRTNRINLRQSVELASSSAKFFENVKKEKERIYPSKKTFVHLDGIPYTATINYLKSTVESWKTLIK